MPLSTITEDGFKSKNKYAVVNGNIKLRLKIRSFTTPQFSALFFKSVKYKDRIN